MDLLAKLRLDPWFASLPADLAEAIVEQSVTVDCRDGVPVYRAGDAPDGMFAILQGSIQMTHISASGICGFCYVKQPPSWFGELAEFDGGPRAQDAVAIGPVRLLHLSHRAFQTIIGRDPRYWSGFAALMGGHVRDLFSRIEAMATLPAKVRVAQSLHTTVVEAMRAGGRPAAAPVSQESLGTMVGISRQTISKILRQMENDGLVRLGYRSIDILQPEVIARLAMPVPEPSRSPRG